MHFMGPIKFMLNRTVTQNITILGHQKKLMLAVKRLAEMQRLSDGRDSLRKKPPPITQQQEVKSMDCPPPEGELPNNSVQFKFNSTLFV